MRILLLVLIAALLTACGPASQPTISKEDALKKWRDPFVFSALPFGICRQANEQGEVNVFAHTILLASMAQGVNEWEPETDQIELKSEIQNNIKTIGERALVTEIEEPERLEIIGEICPSLEETLEDVQTRAKADGLTDGDFETIIEEIQKNLER